MSAAGCRGAACLGPCVLADPAGPQQSEQGWLLMAVATTGDLHAHNSRSHTSCMMSAAVHAPAGSSLSASQASGRRAALEQVSGCSVGHGVPATTPPCMSLYPLLPGCLQYACRLAPMHHALSAPACVALYKHRLHRSSDLMNISLLYVLVQCCVMEWAWARPSRQWPPCGAC